MITGLPHSGKSTLLKGVISGLPHKVGFTTEEILRDGVRCGFAIENHRGKTSVLASVDLDTPFKVSRYCVDIEGFESMLPKVSDFENQDVLYLDEIGQMELFSTRFRRLVEKYLNAPNVCLATLSKVFNDEFIEQVKRRPDVILVEIHENNRESKRALVEALLGKIAKAERYASEPQRFAATPKGLDVSTDHGIRHLTHEGARWNCDCEFFRLHDVCSHALATEQYEANCQPYHPLEQK